MKMFRIYQTVVHTETACFMAENLEQAREMTEDIPVEAFTSLNDGQVTNEIIEELG